MKVFQNLIAMFSFFLLLHMFAITTEAKNGDTYEVIVNSLHVRDSPSTTGEIIGTLQKGNTFTKLTEKSGWYQINYNGEKAWVASNYVQPVEPLQDDIFFSSGALSDYTIVVDPGHGGKDPGAIGHNGVLEKDIILTTSKKIADYLNSTGANVILTRTNDKFVSLDKRIEISNTNKPDAFISIHYNSFSMENVGGFNTYYYSYGSDLELANSIHTSLAEEVNLRNRGVLRDDYRVLRYNNSPAVLIELGFITNSNDLLVIQTEEYQSGVAKAITNGIKKFLLE
ncbi:N-acetylmuramoyl-L-alanine amidase [Ornithinibacillus caprae]|nr:N-acetylmuramoyl-L-alanine amidase [Ornithinibacillus caprae]